MVHIHPIFKDSGIVITVRQKHGKTIYNAESIQQALTFLKTTDSTLYKTLDEETRQEYDRKEQPNTFDTNKYTQFLGAVIAAHELFPVKEVNF